MLKSLLEDGAFARMVYRSRFDCYCSRIELCLDAAVAAGDAVKSPLTPGNRARFAYHVGAWMALVYLPPKPARCIESPIIDIPGIHYECKIVYKSAMDNTFLDGDLEKLYPKKDYHTLYCGEILACYETA